MGLAGGGEGSRQQPLVRLWGPSYLWGLRLEQAQARLTAQGCLSLSLK